jgi:DNA polymerase III epsilon subunit-like protein
VGAAVHVVAFDLETTGLDGERARIIEFCFIELDESLNELARWTELVDPGIPIPADSVKVHGITDAEVKGRPPFSHFAARVQALVQDAVLVAHNHKFDLEILSRELVRAGQPGLKPNHPCIDTQRIEAFVNSHSLGETFKRYTGQAFEGAHRSAADTAACVEVLRRQRAAHAARLPGDLEGLLVANLERRARPDREERNWLDHGRRFYADGKGMIRFGFGKYRDCPAMQVHRCERDATPREMSHTDYLAWMRDKTDFPADVKTLVVSWIGPATRPAAPRAAGAAT